MIFDEVEVACQLVWNSRSQTVSGLVMTNKDLSSLTDVYRILEQPADFIHFAISMAGFNQQLQHSWPIFYMLRISRWKVHLCMPL